MPNVSPYELSGNNGSGWIAPTSVSGYSAGSWKNGFAVYYHNGTTWVEVWNARPEVTTNSFTSSSSTSGIFATSTTNLRFNGTADPNNFSTTAKFEYKEVGGSYSDSGTTSSGMGDNIDGAVSFQVNATVADTYKNWEARASATNTAGTGTGSTVTLDCRKQGVGGQTGWTPSVDSGRTDGCPSCDGCGTSTYTRTTYTKTGCVTYYVDTACSSCGTWTTLDVNDYLFLCAPVSNGTLSYVYGSVFGWIYYTSSSCDSGSTQSYCDSNELLGPGGVQYCSASGAYRVTGSDQCVQVGA